MDIVQNWFFENPDNRELTNQKPAAVGFAFIGSGEDGIGEDVACIDGSIAAGAIDIGASRTQQADAHGGQKEADWVTSHVRYRSDLPPWQKRSDRAARGAETARTRPAAPLLRQIIDLFSGPAAALCTDDAVAPKSHQINALNCPVAAWNSWLLFQFRLFF